MSDKNWDSFVRQRRNFIAASVVLSVYLIAGLEMTELNIFGNTFKIPNPNVVVYLLWGLFVYLFIRYYHYFNEVYNSEFSTKFIARYREKAQPYILLKVRDEAFKEVKDNPDKYFQGYEGEELEYTYTDRGWHDDSTYKLRFEVRFRNKEGFIQSKQIYDDKTYKLSFKSSLWFKVKSALHIIFKTPTISEFYLPYIFGLVPILYSAYVAFSL